MLITTPSSICLATMAGSIASQRIRHRPAAGTSLEDAVSATFILAEEAEFAGMNEEWGKWFPTNPPARQGAKLPIQPKGMRISIALVAEAI